MRISNKKFGTRESITEIKNIKKKFFLLFEGEKTEYIYFECIKNNRKSLGINPLIEIYQIKRSFNESNYSNPKKIVETLIKDLKSNENNEYDLEQLLNHFFDELENDENMKDIKKDQLKVYWEKIKEFFSEKGYSLSTKINEPHLIFKMMNEEICKVFGEVKIEDFIPTLDIDKNIDNVCLIVDRDKKSFKEEQYDYLLNLCEKEKFLNLFVTNPCFEFWLLLHFDSAEKIDKNLLIENKKINGKTFVEKELKKYCFSYNKNNYKPEIFIEKIDNAIINSKMHCNDIKILKEKIGTNLGILIEELRKK